MEYLSVFFSRVEGGCKKKWFFVDYTIFFFILLLRALSAFFLSEFFPNICLQVKYLLKAKALLIREFCHNLYHHSEEFLYHASKQGLVTVAGIQYFANSKPFLTQNVYIMCCIYIERDEIIKLTKMTTHSRNIFLIQRQSMIKTCLI